MFKALRNSLKSNLVRYGEGLIVSIMHSDLSVGVEAAEQMIKAEKSTKDKFIQVDLVRMNPLAIQVNIGIWEEIRANADYYKYNCGNWYDTLDAHLSFKKKDDVVISLFYKLPQTDAHCYSVRKLNAVYDDIKQGNLPDPLQRGYEYS